MLKKVRKNLKRRKKDSSKAGSEASSVDGRSMPGTPLERTESQKSWMSQGSSLSQDSSIKVYVFCFVFEWFEDLCLSTVALFRSISTVANAEHVAKEAYSTGQQGKTCPFTCQFLFSWG